MASFEDLDVWKRSSLLCIELCRVLRDCRDWAFRDQLTRAALSVPSNIAEGYERSSRNEYIRFLRIAKGSCGELRTQLYIAIELGIVETAVGQRFVEEAIEITRMVQGIISTFELQKTARP